MYWFLGSIIMGFGQFLFFFTFRVSLNLCVLAKKIEERGGGGGGSLVAVDFCIVVLLLF